jgi:hypothetical protein
MASRTAGGLFVASHGGHNGESHNHNDVGDVLVYADGQPVIIDVGAGTYIAKTFSKDRYDLWYLNSAHHNVPLINGYQQAAGRKYEARSVGYSADADKTELKMDIAAAYPAEAGVRQWERSVLLDKRRNELSIRDVYVLEKNSGPLTQTFMTVCPLELGSGKAGQIRFNVPGGRPVILSYDGSVWDVKKELMETSEPDEKRIDDSWGHRPIWRVLLVNRHPEKKGRFTYTIRQE